jgi:catechol 2,3-dioxygenase-like lactoylglutathione lyase family enzyme
VRIRPIHFVPDIAAAVRFYRALGLDPEAPAGGDLGLHDAATAADGEGREGVALGFVADEPLEAVERRLREAGFPPEGTIVDQEWGRSLLVRGPDGAVVQIDEQDRELYT